MKKLITRLLLVALLIFSFSVIYLTLVGIETIKFNNQISKELKKIDNNLKVDLKKIKIILDPFEFKLNVKTLGPKLKIKDKTIDIESIKTEISLNSIFTNNFSLTNLMISTRSLELKNLVSFSRHIKNTPELYVLEKIIKRGYFIADIFLEFDPQGKIKKNFNVKGSLRNLRLSLLKKYEIDKLNLKFDFNEKNLSLVDINLLLNNLKISSNKINIKEKDNIFFVDGVFENKNFELDKNLNNLLSKNIYSNLNIDEINFSSKNKFSFELNKKLDFKNLFFISDIELNNLIFKNNLEIKGFFPNIKNQINLNNHKLKIDYSKEKLMVEGSGEILLQKKSDSIKYTINKKKNNVEFSSSLTIQENPIKIDLLNFKNRMNTKTLVKFNGEYNPKKKLILENISLSEEKNKIKIDNLVLDKNFKINNIDKVNLLYNDKEGKKNNLEIIKKKNNDYFVNGKSFNSNALIQNFINSSDKNDINIFSKNFNLNFKIDKVYLDKKHKVKHLKGNLFLKENQIEKANLEAFFNDKEKFKFTVNSNNETKVTTLFLDQAEPIVKQYKFIKGFENGSLDFYSTKENNESNSTLKIYNFRLKELPILTKLLTLASLQGIADILSGEGIYFDEFEMKFNNKGSLMKINEIYAIGPAISILMDGYVEKNKIISLRGSLVPATTINKAIGSIPVLGNILVGSKTGEGVFGVSFKVKGPPKNLETTVNPIKTLTPRFITRTLEKIKKN